MAERLTYEDRQALARLGAAGAVKAMRLLDEAAAKCDAQAAVIERVRALATDGSLGATVALMRIAALAAAAPEHTGPSEATLRERYNVLADSLAAANARVAELETWWKAEEDSARGFARERNAANARVAELEHTVKAAEKMLGEKVEAIHAANARADAAEKWNVTLQNARDEWRAKCEAAEGNNRALRHELSRDMTASGESEAAALRAEVELQQAAGREHLATVAALRAEVERLRAESASVRVLADSRWAQLAAANALLQSAETYIPEALWEAWMRTKRAHLSGQAPERTELAIGERCATCDQRLDAEQERDAYHAVLLDAPTAPTTSARCWRRCAASANHACIRGRTGHSVTSMACRRWPKPSSRAGRRRK